MTHILNIRQASLQYQQKTVFVDVNLSLCKNQWVALLGPSGIGKSSLLRMIMGLLGKDEKIQGTIDVSRAHVAYMAQDDLLLPWLTLLENTLLKTKLRFFSKKARQKERDRAKALLEDVGLADAISLYPEQLSGGMRQRAALARTLMEDKPIILMDEPFSALDAITRYKLQDLAVHLLKDKTVLFITHDPLEALRLAHDIYLMQGQPATLRHVTNLTSSLPRDLNNAELLPMQAKLFSELMQT